MSNIEHSQDYEDGALDALDYITDEREDLEDLTMRVAEKIGKNIVACRKRERGAVALAREAADLLDELTVYWETQDLPPEVQDTFDDVRRRLTADGGQYDETAEQLDQAVREAARRLRDE